MEKYDRDKKRVEEEKLNSKAVWLSQRKTYFVEEMFLGMENVEKNKQGRYILSVRNEDKGNQYFEGPSH